MTCEAKGSIIRDVKLAYISCVVMPSEWVVILNNEIDKLCRWIL